MLNNRKIDFGKMPNILPKGYLKQSISELSKNGVPQGLYTGVGNLDNTFRLDKGRVITITGVPNYGKSEFVDFLTTTYNKKYGMKTLYFSPENQPVSFHLTKLMAKYTGKKFSPEAYTPEEMNSAIDYIGDNFFFMNYERITRLDDILMLSERLIKDKGVEIIVIDAYNKIDAEKSATEIETEFIGKLLDRLCRFAIKHDIMLILVAHPRKMEKDRNQGYQIPTAYDINGSAHFFNKSDYVLTVHRDISSDEVLIRVSKVKFSNYGKQGDCRLKYDVESGNYYDNTLSADPLAFLDSDDSGNGYVHIPFKFPTEVSKSSPLDVEVSCYTGKRDNTGCNINLKDFLFTDRFKSIAEDIRKLSTPEERHAYKNSKSDVIPCATISGQFSTRNKESLLKSSGLICIDIDLKDNLEIISEVPNILKNLPYVCYSAKSISGDGYFAIIPIEKPNHFLNHFYALEEEMKSFGITIDKNCKDITRLRFATYDEDYYYNPAASSFYLEVDTTQPLDRKQTKQFVSSSTQSDEDKVKTEIEFIRNNNISLPDDYDTWFKLAMSLNSSLGEKGRQYFHELSSMSDKYNKYECDNQYDEVLNHYSEGSEVSLGTFFHIVNNAKNINCYES